MNGESNKKQAAIGKTQYSLIPPEVLESIAKVLMYGNTKYTRDSWKNVVAQPEGQALYYDALMRHLEAHRRGEYIDPDSKLLHLEHALTCAAILVWSRKVVPATPQYDPREFRIVMEETVDVETGKIYIKPDVSFGIFRDPPPFDKWLSCLALNRKQEICETPPVFLIAEGKFDGDGNRRKARQQVLYYLCRSADLGTFATRFAGGTELTLDASVTAVVVFGQYTDDCVDSIMDKAIKGDIPVFHIDDTRAMEIENELNHRDDQERGKQNEKPHKPAPKPTNR